MEGEKWNKGSIEFNANPFTQGEGGRDLDVYLKELGITEQDLLGKKVLDLGAGLKAELAQKLKGKADVISLSPDYALEEYRKSVEGREGVVAGVGQQMPFADEIFDVVVMLHVTEHIDGQDLTKITSEILRVLKKGGHAYVAPLIEDPSVMEQASAMRAALPSDTAEVTFEKNGEKTRFDLRWDPSGPHSYVWVDQLRAELQKL